MQRFVTLIFLCFPIFGFTQNLQVQKNWQLVNDFDNIGLSNIIRYDVDDNGTPEIIYGSQSYAGVSVVKTLTYNNGTYETMFTTGTINSEIVWMEHFTLPGQAEEQLGILNDEGDLYLYNVMDLHPTDTIAVPNSGKKFAITDVDMDDTPEIVMVSNSKLYVLDFDGNILNEKSISSINDLAVGNVDEDAESEIVVSATNGYVLNLADLAEDWVFFGGFGSRMVLADIENDGINLIYGAENYDLVTGFDAVPKSPIWELDINNQITDLQVLDINGNGNFEILIGQDWDTDGIVSYDAANRNLLWDLPIPSDGITHLNYGDFDNDGNAEIVYGCGHTTSASDHLVVADPFLLSNEWVSLDLSDGMFFHSDYYNDDEVKDYLICSGSSNSGYDEGTTMVLDGADKSTLVAPSLVDIFSDIKDVSFIEYEEVIYTLYLTDSRLYMYNENVTSPIINEYFSDYIEKARIVQLEEDEPPVLMLLDDNGRLKVYHFHQNVLTELWSTPSGAGIGRDFQIGDFDNDFEMEVAYLAGNSERILSVYNLETHLLEKQINLGTGNVNTFKIADLDGDGSKEVLFASGAGQLKSINYDSNAQNAYPINNSFAYLSGIEVENIDQTPEKEVILLTDRVLIYDNTLDNELFSGEISANYTSSYNNKLQVADIDNDQYMEITVSSSFGVFEYKVAEEYLDIVMPIVKSYAPLDGATLLATNTLITATLSEVIDETTLTNNISVTDANGAAVAFSVVYDATTEQITISPDDLWPMNETLTISLLNGISDDSGNNLDGNYNNIDNDEEDDFSWTINTGGGLDAFGPVISDLSALQPVFQGVSFEVSGLASDASDIAVTHVAYIEYGLNSIPQQGNGTPIAPADGTFDEVEEGFTFELSTLNLGYGDHTIYIQAQDALGNWGQPDSVTFNIIEEDLANWNMFGKNTYNTASNPLSTFTYPATIKYVQTHNGNGNNNSITRCAVVEDYIIYGVAGQFSSSPNQLHCRNIHTNESLWSHTFDISDAISAPAYAYGNIYVQLGDHSDSKLACFDLLSGDLLWETPYSVQWSDLFGPVVENGIVYIVEGYYDSTIGAYDAFTGELKWTYEVHSSDNYDSWNPAVYQDTVYGYAENLSALNPATGGAYYDLTEDDIPFNWPGWSMDASPVVDVANNQLILTSQSFVHAFDLTSKEINWSINSLDYGQFRATPALQNGKLYVPTSQRFMEVDVVTGSVLWENDDYSGYFQPVVNEQVLVFSTYSETVIFDINTKEIKLEYAAGGQLVLSRDYLILCARAGGELTVFEYNADQLPLTADIAIIQEVSCFNGNDGAIQVAAAGGTGAYTYEWSVFQPNPQNVLDGLAAGDYSVTIYDGFQNTITQSITLTEPTEIVSTATTTPENGEDMDGTAIIEATGGTPPYTFAWANFPGFDGNEIGNLASGNYLVTVTDDNGCEDLVTAVVDEIVATNEAVLADQIKIYPTITNDELQIECPSCNHQGTVSVYAMDGQLQQRHTQIALQNVGLSLKGLPAGTYLVSIVAANQAANFRVILTK